jgi:NTP pyrophosphatase (non-canonical NTP hydrolase)
MDEKFEKSLKSFYDLLKLKREKCPWSKELDIEETLKLLEGEISEAKAEINNLPNLQDEIGDVFWNVMVLVLLLEEKGVDFSDIIDSCSAKLTRRSPYIFEDKAITKEEAIVAWRKIKEEEKKKV